MSYSSMYLLEMKLDNLASFTGADWGIQLNVAHECCWDISVRITPTPNTSGPDASTVFFSTGGSSPSDCAVAVMRDVEEFCAPLIRKELRVALKKSEGA